MEPDAYSIEAAIRDSHWWFVSRRRLFSSVIDGQCLKPTASVLDVGTGTGSNLSLLLGKNLGKVTAVDRCEQAIRVGGCFQRVPIAVADACRMPFAANAFDFVMLTDVLEHLQDDLIALSEIARVLVPGGRVLITVPAFQSLWGPQDEVAHHLRRYTTKQLEASVKSASLTIVDRYHFNYILFVPIWLARALLRWLGVQVKSENAINTPFLNRILRLLFTLDVITARFLRPPFGVSILIVAEKSRC